jgi:hypothetical protein
VEGFEIGTDRLLYGSDFLFTQTQFVERFAERMKIGMEALFDEKEQEVVYVGNAERLLEKGAGSEKRMRDEVRAMEWVILMVVVIYL